MVACLSLSLEAICSWLNEPWGSWLGLTDTQSDLPLIILLSHDQVPQLTADCWDLFDAKCWLAVKTVHSTNGNFNAVLTKFWNQNLLISTWWNTANGSIIWT